VSQPRSLSHDYAIRARARHRAATLLFNEGMFCDVIRECQELVELLMKGYLRLLGIDPPKWHDVGPVMQQNAELLSKPVINLLAPEMEQKIFVGL
jgi:HEPN domain-containing protein